MAARRDRYVYFRHIRSVPFCAAPPINRPHSMTADVDLLDAAPRGVLLWQATAAGGYSFYVQAARLRYVHNYLGRQLYRSPRPSPSQPVSTAFGSSSSRPATWSSGTSEAPVDTFSSTSTTIWLAQKASP